MFRLTHGGVYAFIGKEKAERERQKGLRAKAKDETTEERDGKKMVISKSN